VSGLDFESQVAALYQETSSSADEAAFLARVDARVSHQRRTRRWVLATLGTLGASTTVMLLGRSEMGPIVERWIGSAHSVLAEVSSVPWNAAAALVFVSVLILPAFIRALVDPK
jgi:hypothetical protein